MGKKVLAVLLVAVMCLFSGCSYTQLGVDGLLVPPHLFKEEQEVYTAFTNVVEGSIELQYPVRGEYTSAFILQDLDDEPSTEALGFYRVPGGSAVAMPLRINLLDREDGKWVSRYDIGVAAEGVDKVNFVHLRDRSYLVIGYLLSDGRKSVGVYVYRENQLKQLFYADCADYEVYDLDGDNVQEMILLEPQLQGSDDFALRACLYRFQGGAPQFAGQAPLSHDVREYALLLTGTLPDGRPALYVDGVVSNGGLVTQIFAVTEGELENLIYQNDSNRLLMSTLRTYGDFCHQLSANEPVSIPMATVAPGYERAPNESRLYFTDWYQYRDGMLEHAAVSYTFYSLGYLFRLPTQWEGKVTVQLNASDNELTFYDLERREEPDGKLLSIKVVKRENYEAEAKKKGYFLLKDNGQTLYTFKLYDTTSALQLNSNMLISYFNLL